MIADSKHEEDIMEEEEVSQSFEEGETNEEFVKGIESEVSTNNNLKRFFSENIDLEFNSYFYCSRVLEVEQLKNILSKESNHGLTGLKNLSNSCYINTILQCLSHSIELTYYFLSKAYMNDICTNGNSVIVKRGLSKIKLN
jgi:ubiquitin C-terminal hydrolase